MGPVIVDGKVKVVKIWENQTSEGKIYLRLVFESLEENSHLIET